MRREYREGFLCLRLQRKLLVSKPGMHPGTCVTQVPCCMPGSPTCGGGENVPSIPGACATPNFTYLARGPSHRHFSPPTAVARVLTSLQWPMHQKSICTNRKVHQTTNKFGALLYRYHFHFRRDDNMSPWTGIKNLEQIAYRPEPIYLQRFILICLVMSEYFRNGENTRWQICIENLTPEINTECAAAI